MGARGARTRQSIVDAALACFQVKGFQATTVDDIAEVAGISRATLYQYFESKEQIFVEMVHVGSADLMRVVRRLGPLSATAEGYDNLHWWLGEWAWVHDKYRTAFLHWAVVDPTQESLRSLMTEFMESYIPRMSDRIQAAVDDGLELDVIDVLMALLAVLLRANDFRQTGLVRGLSDDDVLDGLATFVQLALFPSTPPSALVVHTDAARPVVPSRAKVRAAAAPAIDRRLAGRLRSARMQPDPARFGSGSPRAMNTVQRLLDAGSMVFGTRGFHAASVEDILQQAGVGRGTFYRYFDSKGAVLSTLAEDCAVRLVALVEPLGDVLAADDGEALRSWLAEFVAFHRKYWGAFRAWTEQEAVDRSVMELGMAAAESVLVTFDAALSRVDRDYPFDVRCGSLVLLALLERVTGHTFGSVYAISDERIVDVLAGLIERGLLGRGRPRPRRRTPSKEAPAAGRRSRSARSEPVRR